MCQLRTENVVSELLNSSIHSTFDVPHGGGQVIKKGLYKDDAVKLARRLRDGASKQNTKILLYTSPKDDDNKDGEEIK